MAFTTLKSMDKFFHALHESTLCNFILILLFNLNKHGKNIKEYYRVTTVLKGDREQADVIYSLWVVALKFCCDL